MKKLFSVLNNVSELLHKHPRLRDSDNLLVSTLWWKYYGDEYCRHGSIINLLTDLSKDKLPSYESVSRCRRKIQEEVPQLRGEKWEKRHESEETVKKELKELEVILDD